MRLADFGQEFRTLQKRSTLKAHDDDTDKELKHLKREMEMLQKSNDHVEKVQRLQGHELAKLSSAVEDLKSKNHGLLTKLGKEKKKVERMAPPPKKQQAAERPGKH